MRALSLTQPWATLIAIGAKRVETRSWRTSFRGEIAIHASKGFPKWAQEYLHSYFFRERLYSAGYTKPADFERGAIIATARLTTVGTTEAIVKAGLNAEQLTFGDFSAGRFGWFLNAIKRLPEPIPCRGALSLWEVPEDIEQQILEQLSQAVGQPDPQK